MILMYIFREAGLLMVAASMRVKSTCLRKEDVCLKGFYQALLLRSVFMWLLKQLLINWLLDILSVVPERMCSEFFTGKKLEGDVLFWGIYPK